jgi:hypothetical protein
MMKSPTRARRLGYLLFAIGFVVGLWLMGGIVWANLEASLFGSGDIGENLTSLRCSLLVTSTENAQARVTLSNPLDRPIKRFVRWRVAQRHLLLVDEQRDTVSLEPGAKENVVHEIAASEGVYGGRFLMVNAFVGSTYPLPALDGSCGVWVLSFPWMNGTLLLLLANLLAVIGMGAGMWLVRSHPAGPESASGGAFALTLLIYIIGMAAILLFRWWVIGGLATLLMTVLMVLWLLYRLDKDWGRVEPPV